MFQIQNIDRKINKLSFCILIFLVSCVNTSIVDVADFSWKMEGKKSEKFNNKNDYFIFYDGKGYKRSNIYNKEKLGFTIADFLKSKNIKVNTQYLIKSIKEIEINKENHNNFIENIKKENNNYNYLIFYSVYNFEGGNNIKTYYTLVSIKIFNIKKNELVAWYSIDADGSKWGYRKIPPLEDFVDEGLEKWWKKTQE